MDEWNLSDSWPFILVHFKGASDAVDLFHVVCFYSWVYSILIHPSSIDRNPPLKFLLASVLRDSNTLLLQLNKSFQI